MLCNDISTLLDTFIHITSPNLVYLSIGEVSSTENMCYHNHWDKCHPDQNGMCRDSCVEDGWDDGQCRNRFKRLMGAKCECYPKTCDH